jgi:hypothetical protein
MKTVGEVDVYRHVLLSSVVGGGNWLASSSGRFTPLTRTQSNKLSQNVRTIPTAHYLVFVVTFLHKPTRCNDYSAIIRSC